MMSAGVVGSLASPCAPVSPRARWIERTAVLLAGLAVLLASQLPAVWGFRAQALRHYPDKVFTGALHTYGDDAATYWSWMDQARAGRLYLTDRFTTEEHPRNYVNLLFWGLGSISRVTGASVVTVYSVARPVLGALLFFLLYLLSTRLFHLPGQRFACFVFLLLSSGWEGLWELLRPPGGGHLSSPQWWTPEMSTVFSLVLFPHFIAGFAAMIGTLLLMLAAWSERERPKGARYGLAAAAGSVMFVLTFFHPYDVVSLVGTIAAAPLAFAFLERKTLARDLALSLIAVGVWFPSLAYNFWLFRQNPAMRAWDLQNVMGTPDARRLAIAFGVGLPLAVLSLLALRRMRKPHLLLWVWLLVILLAIHLPVRFQRRMIGGVQFPLAGLTAVALFLVVLPFLARSLRGLRSRLPLPRGLGAGAVAVGFLLAPLQMTTPFYVWRAEWNRLRRVEYPAWLPAPVSAALRFLAGAPGPEAVVLASYRTGNFVPHFTEKRCVLGHYALTIDASAREAEIARFYAGEEQDDNWRREMLRRWGVRYLVVGPFERELGSFDAGARPWLRLLHVEGAGTEAETAVYAVELS